MLNRNETTKKPSNEPYEEKACAEAIVLVSTDENHRSWNKAEPISKEPVFLGTMSALERRMETFTNKVGMRSSMEPAKNFRHVGNFEGERKWADIFYVKGVGAIGNARCIKKIGKPKAYRFKNRAAIHAHGYRNEVEMRFLAFDSVVVRRIDKNGRDRCNMFEGARAILVRLGMTMSATGFGLGGTWFEGAKSILEPNAVPVGMDQPTEWAMRRMLKDASMGKDLLYKRLKRHTSD